MLAVWGLKSYCSSKFRKVVRCRTLSKFSNIWNLQYEIIWFSTRPMALTVACQGPQDQQFDPLTTVWFTDYWKAFSMWQCVFRPFLCWRPPPPPPSDPLLRKHWLQFLWSVTLKCKLARSYASQRHTRFFAYFYACVCSMLRMQESKNQKRSHLQTRVTVLHSLSILNY